MSLSVTEAIFEGTRILRQSGVPQARREAGSLLLHVIGRDRTFIISHAEDHLAQEDLDRFRAYLERRANGEPLQYITGHQEFFGLDFEVTTAVLIPRPETELLVETALELLGNAQSPLICDVGTGSGCIAITLLHLLEQARAIGVDISEAALQVAIRNALLHGVSDRIVFVASDCFAALDKHLSGFDLVVSNPPYVADDAFPGLQREVRDHEPRVALAPGDQGLAIIRRLLRDAPAYLMNGGHLLMEIGFDQRVAVEQLVDSRIWKLLDIQKDLQGIPRTVVIQKR
jgi:release factor glutamine methyltransferase